VLATLVGEGVMPLLAVLLGVLAETDTDAGGEGEEADLAVPVLLGRPLPC
jgi:hypothetical protein